MTTANRLSDATGVQLTEADYEDWMEGGDNYDKFDEVVLQFLGRELYDEADQMARMASVLEAILDGGRKVTIGGMEFDFTEWYYRDYYQRRERT